MSINDIRHLLDCNLHKSEFAILCALIARRGKDFKCFPSQDTIASDTNTSRTSVNKWIGEMVKKGWIELESIGFKTPNIIIHLERLPVQIPNTPVKIPNTKSKVTQVSDSFAVQVPNTPVKIPNTKSVSCSDSEHNLVYTNILEREISEMATKKNPLFDGIEPKTYYGHSPEVAECWELIKDLPILKSKGARLTGARKQEIAARLNKGATVEEFKILKLAASNAPSFSWHRETRSNLIDKLITSTKTWDATLDRALSWWQEEQETKKHTAAKIPNSSEAWQMVISACQRKSKRFSQDERVNTLISSVVDSAGAQELLDGVKSGKTRTWWPEFRSTWDEKRLDI